MTKHEGVHSENKISAGEVNSRDASLSKDLNDSKLVGDLPNSSEEDQSNSDTTEIQPKGENSNLLATYLTLQKKNKVTLILPKYSPKEKNQEMKRRLKIIHHKSSSISKE